MFRTDPLVSGEAAGARDVNARVAVAPPPGGELYCGGSSQAGGSSSSGSRGDNGREAAPATSSSGGVPWSAADASNSTLIANILRSALQGSAADVERVCNSPAAALLPPDVLADARRRTVLMRNMQDSEAAARSTRMLLTAVSSGDAAAIEQACDEARAVGAKPEVVATAESRARQIREGDFLTAAIGLSDPTALVRLCDEAELRGVRPSIVEAARMRAYQLSEARLLAAVSRSSDAAEIERTCELAEGMGVSERAVSTARQRARQLREEEMLQQAAESGDAAAIERACAQAEAAGACSNLVAVVRLQARNAQQVQMLAAALGPCIGAPPQRPQTAADVRPGAGGAPPADGDQAPQGGADSLGARAPALWGNVLEARQVMHHQEGIANWVFAAVRTLDAEGVPLGMPSAAGERDTEASAAAAARVLESGRQRVRQLPPLATWQPCSVCLERTAEGDDICVLPCLHVFHASCVEAWLRTQRTCPNCRLGVEEPEGDTANGGGGAGGASR